MSNVHSMTREENERVCRAVNRLMESHNSQAELAATIVLPDGSAVSQGQISQALRGMQVGYAFARGVARRMGITIEELLTGVVGRPGLQRYKELPGWDEAAQKINAVELLPPYVTQIVGESYVAFAVERVDATFVYDLGVFWVKHAPISVRKTAEKVL